MPNPSLISTKFNIPRARAHVVIRPRLLETLTEGLRRSSALGLVSAPAGYGKTTLVLSWIHMIKRPCAWLSLAAEDKHLPRFIDYLIASLQAVHPSIGQTWQCEGSGWDALEVDAMISNLIHDLSKLTSPVILVLEDYHVIESTAIDAFVEALIEHLPPHLHIIMTARHDPSLPWARWRAQNQLAEIRATDLKFTSAETTEFLRREVGPNLTDQEIQKLEEQADGWVAGLRLMALSMRNHRSQSSPWSFDHSRRGIADYLISEVLNQVQTERREFLLQTSVAGWLSASLCNAITGREDSQFMLESLESESLFILALDDGGEWFRYHPLFAEILRKRFPVEFPVSEQKRIHQRASRWFADHGFITEAIDHALAARDYEYAACLISPQSEQWMRRGETSTILIYLDQLPKELVWKQSGLCLWYGWCYAIAGNFDSAERWTARAESLLRAYFQKLAMVETGVSADELHNGYGQVLAIRALIARQKMDFAQARGLLEHALQEIPESNGNLRTIVSTHLSMTMTDLGNLEGAQTVSRSARQASDPGGNPFIMLMLLLNESALAMIRGQLHRAYELNMDALKLTQAESIGRLGFLAQFRLGRIHYLWNQLSQARQHLRSGFELTPQPEYAASTVQGYITLARIQTAEGQSAQAMQTLADAETFALEHHDSTSVERVKGVRAQVQLSAGEIEAAVAWARSSGWISFDPFQSGLIFNDESFFALCRTLIALDVPEQSRRAAYLLNWRLKDPEQQNGNSTILEVRLMQALMYQGRAHLDDAITTLALALSMAAPEKNVRMFLDAGEVVAAMLRRIPRSHPSRTFAQQILLSVSNSNPEPLSQLVEPLNEQERNILQLMAQGFTNPEIARKRVLAVSTVRWYVKQIFRKLGVHNRTQAASQARELDLL